MRRALGVGWVAYVLLSSRPNAFADPPGTTVEVTGRVVDIGGRPVSALGVLATGAGGADIRAWARTDNTGTFRMSLGQTSHDFAVKSPLWVATHVTWASPDQVRIVVTRTFGEMPPETGMADLDTWITVQVKSQAQTRPPTLPQEAVDAARVYRGGAWLGLITGQVFDEGGAPLPGVVVVAADLATQDAVASARSDRNGHFALAVSAGAYHVAAHSPGMRLGRAKRQAYGGLNLVMAVDARIETVTISDRPILRFRMSDSIWPAYVPPPEVRRELRIRYDIDADTFCPGDLLNGVQWGPGRLIGLSPASHDFSTWPTSVWQRQCKVPKFWWLHLLHAPPPSPARRTRPIYWIELMAELQAAEARADEVGPSSR